MSEPNIPTVETQMMVRKPIARVFEAFINPEITCKFWFTQSSGKVEEGKTLQWTWDMYGVSVQVEVQQVIQNEYILITWGQPATKVAFIFTPLDPDSTYVVIKNHGFHEKGAALIETIKNNTGGFTTVLDGLKAYLEFGIELNLVKDKFPHLKKP